MKKFGYIFSSGLLKLSLLVLALSGAAWLTFRTPEKIKQAANDSNIYETAVDGIIENTKKEAQKGEANLPLDQPEVEAAAKAAFPPELLSQSSETIIDGVYGWLEGNTEQPVFAVDLTEAKQQLATGLADYAQKRYESLPVCSIAQLRALSPDVDPFSVECRAPTLASSTVRQQVLDKILNSPDFLKDTTFTAEDLPKDEQGKTFTENLQPARSAFKLSRFMPWIVAIIAILCAVGVVFWSDTKTIGARRIGTSLLGTGIFVGLGSLILGWSFKQMNNNGGDTIQQSLIATVSSIGRSFNAELMKFYVTYIVLGSAVLIGLWILNKQNKVSINTKK